MREIYCRVNETPERKPERKSEWLPENPYLNDPHGYIWWRGSQETLKAGVEWLEGNCSHYIKKYDGMDETIPRRHCPECWQELKLSL